MNDKIVIMLVYVDKDKIDIAGNEYPENGYVESKKFTSDKDLRYGLFGILGGKIDSFLYETKSKGFWILVKTEERQLIPVYPDKNRYKFKSGEIISMTRTYGSALNRCLKLKI